jgi:thiamine monophosphate synthase
MKNRKSYFSNQAMSLYCFADTLAICEKLLDGGAKIIQLRNKFLDDSSFAHWPRKCFHGKAL